MGLALQIIEATDAGEVANALTTGPAASINGLVVSDFPLNPVMPSPAETAETARPGAVMGVAAVSPEGIRRH